MTTREQLWTLERTLAFIAEYFGDEAEIAKRYALVVASEIVFDYEVERAVHLARIAELTMPQEVTDTLRAGLVLLEADLYSSHTYARNHPEEVKALRDASDWLSDHEPSREAQP